MSKIVSIETATSVCAVALHESGQLVASHENRLEKSHSSHLLPELEHLLEVAGWQMKALDAVALSAGPGSYTGLRIGAATAKGICYGQDIPLISVSTLEAMARQLTYKTPSESRLVPMIDARRMEVYYCMTDNKGNLISEPAPKVIDENSFSEELRDHPVYFFGNGASKCKEVLAHQSNATFIEGVHPGAHTVGEIAYEKYLKQDFENTVYFEPVYLKEFMVKKPSGKTKV